MTRHPCIVVGYDDSPPARAAVALAALRAGREGLVVIVNAYQIPADWLGWPDYQTILTAAIDRSEQMSRGLAAQIPELDGTSWEYETLEGRPAHVISQVAEARNAGEIIVGSRGFGRARALLGSVAHELIHIASRPVTVIPADAVEAAGGARGGQAVGAA